MSRLRREARRALLAVAGRVLAAGVRPPRPGEARRVLLLRPDHLGDVLLTSPAVSLLEAALPDVELTYLVGPWGAEVARRGPLGDRVEILAFPGFERRPKESLMAPYRLLWREASRLRARRYAAAVVFRPDHWWGALLALAAGIPVRIGFQTPETQPLLSHAFPRRSDLHAAEQSLELARLAASLLGGRPARQARPSTRFDLSNDDRARARNLLDRAGLGGRPIVAIHPSAGAPLKSWPVERWAALADRLGAEGADVLLSGGPEDGDLLRAVAERSRARPSIACGQPVATTAAVLARCSVAVGPDNGPLHLAAAMGTPTVRLYGPAPPTVYGPWPADDAQRVLITDTLACVPCANLVSPPCGAREMPPCMLALTVEEVAANVKALLPIQSADRLPSRD